MRAGIDGEANSAADWLRGEFCEPMFGSELFCAGGRVVDSRSSPEAPHAHADILLCNGTGPRLEVDGLSDCMLAESVVAAIFVAPVLDQQSMNNAVASARSVKALRRNGLLLAGASLCEAPVAAADDDKARVIACFLVAFDGPSDMAESHIWLKTAYRSHGISEPDMPDTGEQRQRLASPGLDGVFVLGRGHLNFDNVPLGVFDDEARLTGLGSCWGIVNAERGSLLSLFTQVNQAATALAGSRLDPRPYLRHASTVTVRLGN